MKTSFKEYLLSRGYAKGSLRSSESTLRIFTRWLNKENLDQEQVRYQDLLLFMKHCSHRGVSQRTIQHYLKWIKHYYEYQEADINPVTPIKIQGVKRRHLYHTLTATELHSLYHKYNQQGLAGKRNKVMLGLLVYQGARSQELAVLETHHVKIREGKIEIPGGKRRNSRELVLESQQVLDMYDYLNNTRDKILAASKAKSNKLFINQQGGRTFSNLMSELMKQVRKMDDKVDNLQQIRASVISRWLKQYNLREVQYRAGHRYISSTEKYLQNEIEGLQEEINRYHPLG